MNTKTSSGILLEAANLLEEEQEAVWGREKYFQFSLDDADKPCMMCAHGAIAYCGNNEVKKNIKNNNWGAAWGAAKKAGPAAAAGAAGSERAKYYTKLAAKENLSLEQYLLKHFGETGLAHYKAAIVGLTLDYNDDRTTSKQDIINKLREAAAIDIY